MRWHVFVSDNSIQCYMQLPAFFKNKRTIGVLLIAAGVFTSCKMYYPTTKSPYEAKATGTSMENGKNLVFNVCGQCHYNRDKQSFIGEPMKDLPGFMGKVYSANITNHPTMGAGRYTDAELIYLLKTGIAKDGRFIPYMVRPTMSDQDLNDIVVYLRSNDDPVKARDTLAGKTHLSFLGKLAMKISGKPLPYQTGIKTPDKNDQVAYGRYLVDITGCYHCHSRKITGLNYMEPEKSKGYMAGGMKWKIDGQRIHSSNLTFDKKTGIGNYTKEDFRKAVREKITPDGRNLRYPMRKFKHLTDQQADAIYAYLKTLPPQEHAIPR